MLSAVNYWGYKCYTQLVHGSNLDENQDLYGKNIFLTGGRAQSFKCKGVRELLCINERVNHSVWIEKRRLDIEMQQNDQDSSIVVDDFCCSISLIWSKNLSDLATEDEVIVNGYCSMPITNLLSKPNLCRQTKAFSFTSYDNCDLTQLSLVFGDFLIEIKNVFKNAQNNIPDDRWVIFSKFVDIFFVEVMRNPTTLITLPMCFELYNHLVNNSDDLEKFIQSNILLYQNINQESMQNSEDDDDQSNNDNHDIILRCILMDYFSMSTEGAVVSSMLFSQKINEVLENHGLCKYYYSYDNRATNRATKGKISLIHTFANKEAKIVQEWLSLVRNVKSEDYSPTNKAITLFAKEIDNLLVDWYGEENIHNLCSESIHKDVLIGISDAVYKLSLIHI